MNYKELNLTHQRYINSQGHSDIHFDWHDQHILDIFLGMLPSFRRTKEDDKIRHLVWDLEKYYRSYNMFNTEPAAFLESLRDRIAEILKLQPDWYGLDLYAVEQYLKMHRFCLISGEGGIGKSFFVMELEAALSKRNIPHLCIYGKREKGIHRIDFNEIAAEEHFVFVVDALNEMAPEGQLDLLEQVKLLKAHRGCRIIITYRSLKVPLEILDQYRALAEYEYEFQGVSFESALDCLTRLEVPNVHMYEDILYSNNPLYLQVLAKTLSDPKLANREDNRELQSITSITHIFEQYIKSSLKRENWLNTKEVADWLYENNKKVISLSRLKTLIKDGLAFFEEMKQRGFMDSYHAHGDDYCYFSMETLSDFLIARSLMRKLPMDDVEGQIALIKQKREAFSSFEDAFTLVLFDRFSPDYKHIRYLMEQTGLWEVLRKETLLKVVFASENIKPFQEVCGLVDPLSCFEIFAGYTNQPFNCANYLNDVLWKKESQLRLSAILEGKYFHAEVLKRLKNILYTLNTVATTSRRIEEAYWFALWCCAAPNDKIRKLAIKLLFDVVSSYSEYRDVTISVFPRIFDHYIQESIVLVLSKFPGDNHIREFFQQLIDNPDFLLARSMKRIAAYVGMPYGYIQWNKANKRDDEYDVPQIIERLTSHIDLAEKYFFPFRWWGRTHIEMHNTFLDVDKIEIANWNEELNQRFMCVTQNSNCCGSMNFAQKAEELLGREYCAKEMSADSFFRTLAKVADELLHTYPVRMKEERYIYRELTDSLVRKCFDIAKDITLGSFMCNYYANQFGTHNTAQDSLGYEVYDPLEHEAEFSIATPLPNFRSDVEDMNDIVAACIMLPNDKNIEWANDIELTRSNLAALQAPFNYKKKEWIMIAGNVKWREDDGKHNTLWEDDYLLWCCTSHDTTILGDGNERYLTIELNDYNGSISEYVNIADKPHLCKQVPSLGSDTFDIIDESGLVLPPAELIRNLNLTANTRNMTWHNAANEIVLVCSNVKYAYFKSTAGRTIFMRKDVFDEYIKTHTLKFFAFTERFHPDTGYAEKTSKHFEMEGGKIQREFINYGLADGVEQQVEPNECSKCPYGFYVPPENIENALHDFLIAFEDDLED